jgi:S-adenosylmethionine decarboxylase
MTQWNDVREESYKTYGQHLILDCYNADPKKLADVGLIFHFLDNFPERIGMKKIAPPQIAEFTNSDKNGVTGIVMIVTSHISIHTYSDRKCFFMDIFSCSTFDIEKTKEYIQDFFNAGKIDYNIIKRGIEFPVNPTVMIE